MNRWFLVFGLVYLVPTVVQARRIGNYLVNVSSESAWSQKHDRKIQIATALITGYTCSATSVVEYSESIRDHHGRWIDTPMSRNYNYDYSLMKNPSVSMRFDRNMDGRNPSTRVRVSETCFKTFPGAADLAVDALEGYLRRKGGNLDNIPFSDEFGRKSMDMPVSIDWICDLKQPLPETVGTVLPAACEPSSWNGLPFDLKSQLISLAREKKFKATFQLTKVNEEFTRDFCEGQKKNRKIIKLAQGVKGRWGEDDFVFHININNTYHFDIESPSGLLDEEIAVCLPSDVQLKITAEEKDPIWNDQYVAKRIGSDSLRLSLSDDGRASGMINLKRGKGTKYDSDIHVAVVDGDPAHMLPRSSQVPSLAKEPAPIGRPTH